MSELLQRYIKIDRLIREQKKNTVAELVDEFQISPRQVKRDIAAMKNMYNAPIKTRRKTGYYYANEHWFLPALGLNSEDLFAMGLASRTLAQFEGTPLHDHLQSVFDRLTQYLDRSKVTVDPSWLGNDISLFAEPVRKIDMKIWETVVACLQERKVAKIKYQSPGSSITTRTIELYHCLFWRGEWYVLACDRSVDEVKMFAVSRMKSAAKTVEEYSIPADFDLKDYIDPEMGMYVNDGPKVTVKVLFDKAAAPYAAERSWHRTQKKKENPDGSLELTFVTNQLTQTTSWLLAWGKSAQVLEPPELVKRMKDHAVQMAKFYR